MKYTKTTQGSACECFPPPPDTSHGMVWIPPKSSAKTQGEVNGWQSVLEGSAASLWGQYQHDRSNYTLKKTSLSFCRQLCKSLGQAGEIEPESEGILTEYGVDFSDFSPEVLECLPQNLPWVISPGELAKRRDLR